MEANLGQQESATCLGCGEWEKEKPALVGASRQLALGSRGMYEINKSTAYYMFDMGRWS